MDAHAEHVMSPVFQFDIGAGLGVRAGGDGVLVVADEAEALSMCAARMAEKKASMGPLPLAAQFVFLVVIADGAGELDLRMALAADSR